MKVPFETTKELRSTLPLILLLAVLCSCNVIGGERMRRPDASVKETQLEWICLSEDGRHFELSESGSRFIAWGFNYDHDRSGRLIEDYWHSEWPTVVEDFWEMKALGANVVRIHLQTAKFMETAKSANEKSLERLARLVRLAEETDLYLDITGLGCYHKQDVPEWYDAMDEAQRWETQALFWESVSRVCAQSPAVFFYDLMNEPVLAGKDKPQPGWLAGDFAGKYFVQYITRDLAGRTREVVAKAWVDRLVGAIRKYDSRHLITVGVIPWAHVFPSAKPFFYSKPVSENLDFVCVHFYPKPGEVAQALEALSAYDIGKPIIVEEMFPLKCSLAELDEFIEGSRSVADGWIGFYWGQTIEEYGEKPADISAAITKAWLEFFKEKRL